MSEREFAEACQTEVERLALVDGRRRRVWRLHLVQDPSALRAACGWPVERVTRATERPDELEASDFPCRNRLKTLSGYAL